LLKGQYPLNPKFVSSVNSVTLKTSLSALFFFFIFPSWILIIFLLDHVLQHMNRLWYFPS
jgi:hypothetical protein